MSGIVGFTSRRSEEECHAALGTMMAAMKCEAGHLSGSHFFRDLFVHVGWVCRKGEFADGMPICNASGDVVLFLTGEVYVDPDRVAAWRHGAHHAGDGDAGCLIDLYEEQGIRFFENLNGLFSGLLLDCRQRAAFLFNDRYGMRRLFVHEGHDGFYFASHAGALLAALPDSRQFDRQGLAQYLTCGCTIGARSLFRAVDVLPPASMWEIAGGAVQRKGKYFNRSDWENQEPLDAVRFTHGLMEMLPRVVRRYARSRLPLGISLTGGLDSRMLVACMDMAPGQVPCYTFGSMYRETLDVRIAREVAVSCGQDHSVLELDRNFLRHFPRCMEDAVSLSDGYLGLSGAAELYVNALARKIAPVRLTGNYGSELLRGVRAFKATMPGGGFLTTDLVPLLEEASREFDARSAMNPVSFALFHLAPNQGFGRFSIENSQVVLRTPFMDNDLVGLVYRKPVLAADGTVLSISVIARNRPDLMRIPTDRGVLGNGIPPARWMRRLYFEGLFKAEYWASHGMPHWIARLTGKTPALFPEKKLLGLHKFQHFQRWLRRDLSGYVKDTLLCARQLPAFVEKQHLERMLRCHMEGRGNYLDEIDKALTLVEAARLLFGRTDRERVNVIERQAKEGMGINSHIEEVGRRKG